MFGTVKEGPEVDGGETRDDFKISALCCGADGTEV